MRYILLLLLVTKLNAQTPTINLPPQKFKQVDTIITTTSGSTIRIRTADTGISSITEYGFKFNGADKNTMPNAFSKNSFSQNYVGNNGIGFDLYKSNIDNMPVLKPDANNAASLGISVTPQPIKKITNNGTVIIQRVTPYYKFKLIPPLGSAEKKRLELFNVK